MCSDNPNEPGSGCVKAVAITLLIFSVLCLDILGVVLASVVLCGCCGTPAKNKKCLLIFSVVSLVLELIGVGIVVWYAMKWIDTNCEDTVTCKLGDCDWQCAGGRFWDGAGDFRALEAVEAAAPEASTHPIVEAVKLGSSFGPVALFPIWTSMLHGRAALAPAAAKIVEKPWETRASESRQLSSCAYDGIDKCCSFQGYNDEWWCVDISSCKEDICDFLKLIGHIILAVGLAGHALMAIIEAILLCALIKLKGDKPSA